MRITKISIKELFGNPAFNYEIELKTDPPITIIHGRNGSGKTIIFKMIHGLFNFNYFIFGKYPFREFRMDFDDNEYVLVIRGFDKGKAEYQSPTIIYSKSTHEPLKLDFAADTLRGLLPPSRRWDVSTSELLDSVIDLFSDKAIIADTPSEEWNRLMDRLNASIKLPEWLHELHMKLKVNLIDTKRESIEDDSKNLSHRIREVILSADAQAKTLDSTFPGRVVKNIVADNEKTLKYDEIQKTLAELEEERKRLVEDGLLAEQETGFQIAEGRNYYDKNSTLANVLQIYVKDTKEKLNVYQELADKITVFKDIVEGILSDKKLAISQEGFEIKGDAGLVIPLKELSSGEQHMIVLIYTLLFHNTPDEHELILIDEPELSLHIVWQKRFISDLEKIMKLLNFDVMIATHSPAIINGRWDLEIGLQSESAGGE